MFEKEGSEIQKLLDFEKLAGDFLRKNDEIKNSKKETVISPEIISDKKIKGEWKNEIGSDNEDIETKIQKFAALANSLLPKKEVRNKDNGVLTILECKKENSLQSKIKCKVCLLQFQSQRQFYNHMFKKHEGYEVECHKCEYKANKRYNLNRHIKIHQKQKIYTKSCKFCGKTFSSKFYGHRLVLHHINKEHLKLKYSCEQCNYTTDRKYNLNIHIKRHHEKIRYQCTVCEYEAMSRTSLKYHVQSIHENVTYPCKLCNMIFKGNTSLKDHILVVHEKKGQKCSECDYRARNNANLKIHYDSVHRRLMNYSCDKCIFQTANPKTLKQHISAKHEGAKFDCDQCDLIVSTVDGLRRHKKKKHKTSDSLMNI